MLHFDLGGVMKTVMKTQAQIIFHIVLWEI